MKTEGTAMLELAMKLGSWLRLMAQPHGAALAEGKRA